MNPEHDYASRWPALFEDLPAHTRDAVLRSLAKSAGEGAPPRETDARLLVDFALGRITAHEYTQRVLARLTGTIDAATGDAATVDESPVDDEPAYEAPVAPEPPPVARVVPPAASKPEAEPLLDHEAAAVAFVRGDITVERYLQNVRKLRNLSI